LDTLTSRQSNRADRRSKDEIRQLNEQKILDAAEKTFAIYGFKGSTTKQIALQAGLPKANIHYYFDTKLNLYRCVLESMLSDWMKAARTFKGFDSPDKALKYYVGAKMDLARRRPYGSRVWASEIMSGAPVMEEFLATTLKSWVDDCVGSINSWIEDKKIVAIGDANTLLYMIWASTQHYADFDRQITLLNQGKSLSDDEFEQKKQQVIDLILRSVGLQP